MFERSRLGERKGIYEFKYLVSHDVAERLRRWARKSLDADPHGGGEFGDLYRITSLYFDTPFFDTFHQRGTYGRNKYRVRRYGDSDVVFLERKQKRNRLITKRRAIVPLVDLLHLDPEADAATGEESALSPEANWPGAWFAGKLLSRKLSAKCQIGYDRIARTALTPSGSVRFTLDNNIEALDVSDVAFQNRLGARLLETQYILELKFQVAMPAMFKALTQDLALEPSVFSKYRLAATQLNMVSPDEAPCPTS
jgi:hypothetical protein